jgi:hypothetical protein
VSSEYLALLAALLGFLHVQTDGSSVGATFLEACALRLQVRAYR